MKQILVIIFLFFLFVLNSFALEKDSVFVVHIENDTTNHHLLNNRISIVFENISNDTIILLSKFKHYHLRSPGSLGYSLFFYYNKKPVFPTWGDPVPSSYTYGDGCVKIAPKEVIKMIMSLPLFGNKESAKNNEFGIELWLRYCYFSTEDSVLKHKYFKSEYLILTYK